MPTNKEIDRLNKLFADHLGINLYGEPLYSWKYSENLLHPMRLIGQYTEVKGDDCGPCPRCGGAGVETITNYEEESDTGTFKCQRCDGTGRAHVIRLQPKYEMRRMCFPKLFQQWVICKWVEPGPQETWERIFGSNMEWPRRGYLIATNACLGPNEPPDESATREFITIMQKDRTKTFWDWVKEAEDAIALQERRNDSRIAADIDDVCTAFGNPKPGCVGGGISLPSAAFKKNYDSAFRK